MNEELVKLFKRDLEKLITELEAYPDETAVWRMDGEIKNSAGNLALHLVGNLNQFIGVKLGGTDFVRDRDAEFASRDLPRATLISQLRDTIAILERVLSSLDAATLEATYPQEVLGYPMTTRYFLMHLYGHLNYHLGQINYHRRLLR
ncbi:MAG: DinB family protein [Pleurocapsa sp. SU_196_0]|nr:DinB family protein [Pleurocapsa sp. SU_196_0]